MILCTSFSWHNVILHIPIHFSSYFRLGYGRLIRFSGNLHLLRGIFLLKHGFRHHTPFVLNLTLSISPPPASSLAFALGTDGGRVSAGAGWFPSITSGLFWVPRAVSSILGGRLPMEGVCTPFFFPFLPNFGSILGVRT
jgi:hypothetical protein